MGRCRGGKAADGGGFMRVSLYLALSPDEAEGEGDASKEEGEEKPGDEIHGGGGDGVEAAEDDVPQHTEGGEGDDDVVGAELPLAAQEDRGGHAGEGIGEHTAEGAERARPVVDVQGFGKGGEGQSGGEDEAAREGYGALRGGVRAFDLSQGGGERSLPGQGEDHARGGDHGGDDTGEEADRCAEGHENAEAGPMEGAGEVVQRGFARGHGDAVAVESEDDDVGGEDKEETGEQRREQEHARDVAQGLPGLRAEGGGGFESHKAEHTDEQGIAHAAGGESLEIELRDIHRHALTDEDHYTKQEDEDEGYALEREHEAGGEPDIAKGQDGSQPAHEANPTEERQGHAHPAEQHRDVIRTPRECSHGHREVGQQQGPRGPEPPGGAEAMRDQIGKRSRSGKPAGQRHEIKRDKKDRHHGDQIRQPRAAASHDKDERDIDRRRSRGSDPRHRLPQHAKEPHGSMQPRRGRFRWQWGAFHRRDSTRPTRRVKLKRFWGGVRAAGGGPGGFIPAEVVLVAN